MNFVKLNIDQEQPLAKQYAELVAGLESENKRQDNPLSLPNGYYAVETAGGKKLGMGFYCEKCKLNWPGNAPKKVRHCGKVSKLPTGFFEWFRFFWRLQTYKLPRR